MSIQQHEAHEQLGAVTVAVATAAIGIIPAAFWGAIALLLWGWLPATIVAMVALLGSIFMMALVRSGRDVETPAPAAWAAIETVQFAPGQLPNLQQAA